VQTPAQKALLPRRCRDHCVCCLALNPVDAARVLRRNAAPLQPDLEGMADVCAEASQRAALGNTAATATAVYALPVMNAVCYRVQVCETARVRGEACDVLVPSHACYPVRGLGAGVSGLAPCQEARRDHCVCCLGPVDAARVL
jgi:hypothetical protein